MIRGFTVKQGAANIIESSVAYQITTSSLAIESKSYLMFAAGFPQEVTARLHMPSKTDRFSKNCNGEIQIST